MAEKINPKAAAISLGTVFALSHLVGISSLFLGVMNAWQRMHFMMMSYTLKVFDAFTMFLGLITAFALGALIGWVFATVYNSVASK